MRQAPQIQARTDFLAPLLYRLFFGHCAGRLRSATRYLDGLRLLCYRLAASEWKGDLKMASLAFADPVSFEFAQSMIVRDERLDEALRRTACLDFSMLKEKLVEERGWTEEFAAEVEDLYRKFLALNARYPDRKVCPTGPIDDFWHAHILDTRAYAADCDLLFGRFLHHFPYFGMRGPDDRADLEQTFQESVELFIIHFGIDPTAGDTEARGCSSQRCP